MRSSVFWDVTQLRSVGNRSSGTACSWFLFIGTYVYHRPSIAHAALKPSVRNCWRSSRTVSNCDSYGLEEWSAVNRETRQKESYFILGTGSHWFPNGTWCVHLDWILMQSVGTTVGRATGQDLGQHSGLECKQQATLLGLQVCNRFADRARFEFATFVSLSDYFILWT